MKVHRRRRRINPMATKIFPSEQPTYPVLICPGSHTPGLFLLRGYFRIFNFIHARRPPSLNPFPRYSIAMSLALTT
jgi:hypothetical protein